MITLAIDFGLKHIGLALSDRDLTIASPFKTIPHRNLATTTEALLKIIAENNVALVVLGDPQNDSTVRTLIHGLAKRLKAHLPVAFVDESATTFQSSHSTDMVQLKPTHAHAAALILERYINGQK